MTPVFVGGCQRSGTTLLASVIAAHSTCVAIPEAPFKWPMLQKFSAGTPVKEGEFTSWLLQQERFKIWKLSIGEDDVDVSSFKNCFDALVKKYAVNTNKENVSHWVDHTTENLKYASTLLAKYPGAKFIHIIRDGRAAAASVLPLDWGPSDIEHAAKWWVDALSYGFAAERFLKEKLITITYEQLISKPQETIEKICSFLGISFTLSMLEANGFNVPSYTKNQHNLVGKSLDNSRLNAWKSQLTAEEVKTFEYKTGDMLPLNGYEKLYATYMLAAGNKKLQRVIQRGIKIFLINPVRQKLRYNKSKK